ncbi:mitochondrial rho 1 [Phaffia rhodozyma]|uniref:Mitochondrial Rho GTPase n=1 Tax=Phaffia rhodozyma TaxID=264483 RepID=A0A0F7STS0_PHARH|nr:mitochondrial rho 1 [Phaffia rhodozyma]
MRRDVRVLFVGDEGVGKSTIITSFIKGNYIEHVQRVLPEVTIPDCLDSVTATIVDSSSRPADRAHLDIELRKAHVIVIVYSIDHSSSFDRLGAWWLPYIRAQGVNVPVVICGNKIDLRGGEITNQELEREIAPLMNEFKEVETCVECSSRVQLNVAEVIFFALKAVCYPLAPLYDSREHTLKPKCVDALRRIFKLCDVNKDGILDPNELNDFQRKCFGTPLQLQEIESLLRIISEYDPQMVDGGGVTESGIVYFHTRFIQQGRVDTMWTVLSSFGYGEDLDLKEEVLRPKFDVPSDCSVELSPSGYQFLTEIFEIFDKDQDGALSEQELAALFSTSPGNPWMRTGFPDTTVTTGGKVTLQGWLAQWSLTTLLDHRLTLSYLCYLGYSSLPSSKDLSTTTALHLTRPRRQDRKAGKVTRNVFLVYVLGAAGSGKTSLLRAFVNKRFEEEWEPTSRVLGVVNGVERGGREKYLVLQEFGSKYESEILRNTKKLELADVIVYVHDSSDTNSFSYISNLRQQHKLNHIPCLFVATKSDLDLAQQRHEVQPDVYCKRLGLPVPISVSVRQGQTADLWSAICRTAMNPHSAIPKSTSSSSLTIPRLPTVLTTLGVFSVGTYLGLRWYKLIGHPNANGGPSNWVGVIGRWIGLGVGFRNFESHEINRGRTLAQTHAKQS